MISYRNYNCIGLLVQKIIPLCFFKTYTLYSLFNLPMTTVAASFIWYIWHFLNLTLYCCNTNSQFRCHIRCWYLRIYFYHFDYFFLSIILGSTLSVIFIHLCCIISALIQIIQSQCKTIIICHKDWHLRLIKFNQSLIIWQSKKQTRKCPFY